MTKANERLVEMRKRFEEIEGSKADRNFKDIRLATLMTDLERVFEIPTVSKKRYEGFEKRHPEVAEFYQQVNYARAL